MKMTLEEEEEAESRRCGHKESEAKLSIICLLRLDFLKLASSCQKAGH